MNPVLERIIVATLVLAATVYAGWRLSGARGARKGKPADCGACGRSKAQ